MLLVLLSLAMVGQQDDDWRPARTAAEVAIDDLGMERACEEFVATAISRRDVAPRSPLPPDPYRSLTPRLGATSYCDRDQASRDLMAAVRRDADGRRWLWWIRRDADLEVQLRANAAIRRISPCPSCEGRGHSKSEYAWECWECGGLGTVWPKAFWD